LLSTPSMGPWFMNRSTTFHHGLVWAEYELWSGAGMNPIMIVIYGCCYLCIHNCIYIYNCICTYNHQMSISISISLSLSIYIHTVQSDVTQLNQLSSTTTYNNLIWLNEFTSLKYPVPGFAGTFSLMQCQASPWIFFGALMCKISPLQLWRVSFIGNRFAFARLRGLWWFLDLNATGL
jgi:hypothetical protein